MSNHRRKRNYRKTVIATVAIAAVGIPSVAMACMDGQGDRTAARHHTHHVHPAHHHAHWQRASTHHRWERGSWSPTPTASTTQSPAPTATATQSPPAAKASPTAITKPAAKASPTAAKKPTAKATPTPTKKPAAKATPTPTTTPTAKATTSGTAPSWAAPAKAPSTPAAASSAAATPASSVAARVVQLVNSERSKYGCAPLTVNAELTKAAQDHSKDMAAHQTMSHTGSDGSSPGERITAAGYSWSTYGENVAYGYSTPESVMTGWMNSPGHRANILNCAFKEIGVGYAQPGNYWTQDFGAAR
jgi:uncharacterized protein YkwD